MKIKSISYSIVMFEVVIFLTELFDLIFLVALSNLSLRFCVTLLKTLHLNANKNFNWGKPFIVFTHKVVYHLSQKKYMIFQDFSQTVHKKT